MEKSDIIKFQQPRDFGQVLAATFQYIRQNFKSLALSIYAIGLPLTIVASFLMSAFYSNMITDKMPNGTAIASMVLGYVLFMLSFVAVYATIIEHMRLYIKNGEKEITVSMVWAGVKQRILPYLGATFLIGTMIVAAPLLGGLMFVFGTGGAMTAIFVLIEFVLYLFAIYLSIRAIFSFIVLSHEERSIVDSIKRSFWATEDKWWFTFGLGFVSNIIQSFLSGIVFLPLYIIFILFIFLSTQSGENPFEEESLMGVLLSLVMFLYFGITLFTYSIPAVALTLQFHSVVEQREGEGLAERIAAFGAPEEEVDPESLL